MVELSVPVLNSRTDSSRYIVFLRWKLKSPLLSHITACYSPLISFNSSLKGFSVYHWTRVCVSQRALCVWEMIPHVWSIVRQHHFDTRWHLQYINLSLGGTVHSYKVSSPSKTWCQQQDHIGFRWSVFSLFSVCFSLTEHSWQRRTYFHMKSTKNATGSPTKERDSMKVYGRSRTIHTPPTVPRL